LWRTSQWTVLMSLVPGFSNVRGWMPYDGNSSHNPMIRKDEDRGLISANILNININQHELSEWLLFNSVIFQPYHGKNKLIFNEISMTGETSISHVPVPNKVLSQDQQQMQICVNNESY
jgi:hypothetical protein